MHDAKPTPSSLNTKVHASRIGGALDALNFFLADVRDGLGPYLAIYLLTIRHWDEASIGIAMSIGTVAGLLAQTPAGALVDAVPYKRGLLVIAALLVTGASLALPWLPTFWSVGLSQAAAHGAAAVFAPLISAITLGIVGHRAFAHRIGRNESFNHAGNAFAAPASGSFDGAPTLSKPARPEDLVDMLYKCIGSA
jgi:sugar phosphate permease